MNFQASLSPVASSEFVQGYCEAVEFCGPYIPEGESVEIIGFSESAKATILRDCDAFAEANASDIVEFCEITNKSLTAAGAEFYFTRNGHGTGFWDRGTGPVFDRLSEAARDYGSSEDMVGDDGLIYCNA